MTDEYPMDCILICCLVVAIVLIEYMLCESWELYIEN